MLIYIHHKPGQAMFDGGGGGGGTAPYIYQTMLNGG